MDENNLKNKNFDFEDNQTESLDKPIQNDSFENSFDNQPEDNMEENHNEENQEETEKELKFEGFNEDKDKDYQNNTNYEERKYVSEPEKTSKLNIPAIILGCICALLIGFMIGKNLNEAEKYEENAIKTETNETIVYRDNGDVSDIVESVSDSIVSITSTAYYQQFNFFTGITQYEGQSSGSGVIVGKNDTTLYIVTNNHVIEGAEDLTIEFSNGTSVSAAINGTSTDPDIAILTVNLSDIDEETLNTIKVASLHTEDDLEVGNQVIAIGNALGYGQTVTVGYISALDRTIQTEDGTASGLIQTDTAINPGNSGGALVNMNGEVIGINVAKYADTDVEGIGYSIPITSIQDLISMLSKEKVNENEQGMLGIQCTNIDSSMSQQFGMPQGVYVYKITNNNLNDEGLCEKDIITAIEGRSVTSVESLTSVLEYYKTGDEVELTIQRIEDGEYVEKTITVTLIEKGE